MLNKLIPLNLNLIFHSLSDATRREIINMLFKNPNMSVSEIARPFDMSLPAITKHLNVLQKAGILIRTKIGRQIYCSIDPSKIKTASDFLDYYSVFWNNQFDNLEKHLNENSSQVAG